MDRWRTRTGRGTDSIRPPLFQDLGMGYGSCTKPRGDPTLCVRGSPSRLLYPPVGSGRDEVPQRVLLGRLLLP